MKKNPLINVLRAFAPAVIWAGIIFFFSDQEVLPGLSISAFDFLLKKSAHIFVFAILYLLLMKGFGQVRPSSRYSWWQALLICLLYACADEIHQTMVSGRNASTIDVGFDITGVTLAFLRHHRYI
ncbi:MAG TPA: VanZ family protein [Candidatus Woesebacteria bacterium]|nr:VanZ family protein [Candidatus Woesebacteria bacterium]